MLSDRNVINDRMGAKARSSKKIETKEISPTIPHGSVSLRQTQSRIMYFSKYIYLLLKIIIIASNKKIFSFRDNYYW